ncbi:poly-gamma-glutamate capsule biosynthesis protein CapA/YwtB (metallophosphatase superfamily) [Parabacteroides sp. PFB2-10]|uniref:CapA family protein n=1 Tax=Parabacteroides sp. PFB2-10 TaxID=1742405 RepID=UPI0024769D87|nr:CapA family protein [Parabacteroides sp. PFB2-10]MDH6312241.1 poly-gamma-glutamate capsule biosynthesis protein CapA/YwtB (metallophosphatase superfamily) [Parabacteroides sp. PFB2-10]
MRWRKQIVPVIFGMILCLVTGCSLSSKKEKSTVLQEETTAEIIPSDTLCLLFAGDLLIHTALYPSAWSEGGDSSYRFSLPFRDVKTYISSADVSIANLEVPLGGKPYSGYPMFSSPSEIADAVKETGFDILLLANNHAVDRGRRGLGRTLDYLDRLGLEHTGAFRDSVERSKQYPLVIDRNNIRVALLNYTYGTNGIPVSKPAVINLIDTLQMREDIRKAREQKADYIIACLHWGYEYQRKEHAEQREVAHFLAEEGVDLIVGGHPHVVQPYKEITRKTGEVVPVIYSLGNFISNQQWRYADGGIVFDVTLIKKEDASLAASFAYEPVWVNRFQTEDKAAYRLIPVNRFYHDPGKYDLDAERRYRMEEFYLDTRRLLPDLPYSGFYNYP